MSAATALVEQQRGGWVARGLLGPTSDQLTHLAQEEGWLFVEVVLTGASDKKKLMRLLADQLRLPEAFGANWDALADSLWDMGEGRGGTILRLKGLASVPHLLAGRLVEILDDRTQEGPSPLVVVADPPLPRIAAAHTTDSDSDQPMS